MVTLVVNSMVVELVFDVIEYLVTKGLYGIILIIDTSMAVVSSSILPPISVTGVTL